MLSQRRDIIVITDEAHRGQYDTLALNMRTALPDASFLAFTGTPLIVGEDKTRQVLGDYVSVYGFRQSVKDGATVPRYCNDQSPAIRNRERGRIRQPNPIEQPAQSPLGCRRVGAGTVAAMGRSLRLPTIWPGYPGQKAPFPTVPSPSSGPSGAPGLNLSPHPGMSW